MNFKSSLMLILLALCLVVPKIAAGPITVGVCYTACNAAYVSCLAAWGITAGTTGPIGWYAWLVGAPGMCSAVQGVCMSACAASFLLPTP